MKAEGLYIDPIATREGLSNTEDSRQEALDMTKEKLYS